MIFFLLKYHNTCNKKIAHLLFVSLNLFNFALSKEKRIPLIKGKKALIDKDKRKEFSQLVRLHQREVYFFVRKMVLNHDDANDITQNTFIKAWKGLSSFRKESKFSTWVMRIAYNESINFLNKKKRIFGISLKDVQAELPSVLAEDRYYTGDEIQRILQTAVATLPEKQKAVFVLRYFENKKYEEIAAVTGTSIGSLKASFHHAKNKVKEFVEKHEKMK